ncbi:DUF3408 domain-containing protein [Bacteroides fragilis]|nr:DUF3408 domain-containing protein [Bacteroides fragilis]MCE9334473.1 DUF3408 domain-containing protein [Bacteroides fragilis]MCS2489613.1 DUF3408 domain-containing protein [Bacteroides fragilis]UVQ86122.1 DUF3408 domain-containing protein [Bacteroides fragilis]
MSDNLGKFITPGQVLDVPEEKNPSFANERTQQGVPTAPTSPTTQGEQIKRSSPKQRRASMEEYQQTYLTTPKIVDRQTIFISRTLRDEVDIVVRRLGDRKLSVSGFVENLVRAHLNDYASELDGWKRM